MTAVAVAEGLAILLLGLLVAGLLRSHAEILKALHDLGAGLDPSHGTERRQPVPVRIGGGAARDLVGVTPADEAVAVAVDGAGRDTLLAFLSSGCLTCRPFWQQLREGVDLPAGARLVVVTQGPDAESPARVGELAAPGVTVVMSSEAWLDYDVPGSPHFAYVDGRTGRVVGEGTGHGWAQVLDLLTTAGVDAPNPRDNAARVDAELAAAGIGAGHPSLHMPPEAEAL